MSETNPEETENQPLAREKKRRVRRWARLLGHRIKYNHYSIRSDDFPAHKTDRDEVRVLVVGDSIVNGGVRTDQSELASEILTRKLAENLKRPVVVANISANSWGPPNELAYLKRYGLFDADVLVIVMSSHDYMDVPTFAPVVDVDPTCPGHKPVSALWEGIPYAWSRRRWSSSKRFVVTGPAKQADIEACMGALREMIQMGRARGAKVIVALHLGRDEPLASPQEGHDYFVREAKADGVTPVELGAAFEAARKAGEEPYRDIIHPNATGQRIIATTLLPVIEGAVRGAATTTTPGTR